MDVVQRDPATLTPHPRNSRLHSDAQITALGRAMLALGFHQPVVIDPKGTILVGHARVRAAIGIGLKAVPCVVLDMPEAKARALIIADNRLREFGSDWDRDMLDAELRDLMVGGWDVSLTGFDVPELAIEKAPKDEDEAPPLAGVAVSMDGDVWEMDGHRLVVGSCTDPLTVSIALGGKDGTPAPVVNLMVTDPPYGVDYDPDWRNHALRADGSKVGGRAVGKVQNDDRADWREAWALFPGDVAYIWHGGLHAVTVADSLQAAGFSVRSQIVWVKHRHVISRGHYHSRHEPCAYAVRDAKKPRENWRGGRGKQSSVWRISHSRSATGHGTQKPVEAMRRPMLNHTLPGEVVYDPFLGSGTSIIAAHTCARRCVGLEIDPLYADVIIKRYEAFTGNPARLAGETFAAVAEARMAASGGIENAA